MRLYPIVNLNGFKFDSLIDVNNFYRFSKNNFSHERLQLKINDNYTLKPAITFHTNPFEKKVSGDINLSYNWKRGFGYYEINVTPSNTKDTEFYTYDSLNMGIGNLGLFTTGKINDANNTYAEIGFTGRDIKRTGISPYLRINVQKGVKPTYQAGISVNPRNVIKRFNRKK